MELLHELSYVEVIDSNGLSDADKEFISDIKKYVHDIALHQAGKKNLKSAKQLLDEI